MASKKKYYWIRLKNDFFSDGRIKKLRKIDDSDTYVLIYLKLLLLSIKNDKSLIYSSLSDDFVVLIYESLENSFEEEIAMKIDEEEDKVKKTIEFFFEYKMMIKLNEKNSKYK